MSEHIDAVTTAGEITATYRRYLQSLLAVRDPQLNNALHRGIAETPMLDKGPYLEATPPYLPGKSCSDLIDEGILEPGFTALDSPALPLARPLYVHQEQAIRKVAAGRNVVVATGTGSGKTESFLLPILNSLVAEDAAGTLDAGVRALLLYPMNALANDQMKRLRRLLAEYPQLTFGRYTGDTESDPKRARDRFEELNIGEPLLTNELLSRQEMQATPPHILLTNYAMLEYLLLRAQDMELFATGTESKWRFIAVDEAHVYDGTQGAEIAMLMRRVRDRVAADRRIQCIATSATVGGDTDPAAVTAFASRLFGEEFEWNADDPDRQDLVLATRVAPPSDGAWGPLSPEEYHEIAAVSDRSAAIVAAAQRNGSPAEDAAAALSREERLVALRRTLAGGPKTFSEVARTVFGDVTGAKQALTDLVDLASSTQAADGTTVLSARYHLFLRATEGAFTCLSPSGPHVQLARHELCPDCNAPMFEVGSCKRCGAVHLVGRIEGGGKAPQLLPRRAHKPANWLFLGNPGQDDEDEEALERVAAADTASASLCTRCGSLNGEASPTCRNCSSSELRIVTQLRGRRGDEIAGCLVCGARGEGTVRLFESGPDASGAVIATSLYQRLPADDDRGAVDLPGEGRKLLMFSDSRQAAAYFAPYLEDSYGRLQRRRLLVQALESAGAGSAPIGVPDLRFEIRRHAAEARQFQARMTAREQEREVAPWVMAEAVAVDDRVSLEGLGLVRIYLERDPSWVAPAPLLQLGLTEDEAWDFIQELLRTLRQQGALTMPDDVPPNHEIFSPRLGPIFAREDGPEPGRKVLSWLPGRGTNRRIDYTEKVLAKLGAGSATREVLAGVWKFLTVGSNDWLRSRTQPGLGVVNQIDHEMLRFELVTPDGPMPRCSTCRRYAPFSIRGVCPALGCGGTLESRTSSAEERDHYRTTYRSMLPVPLRALEHTAQWRNTEAARVQQDFIRGRVNALSCSTTFELGVDVGELQAVMLRNMPPSTANYVQRAGRAGRRAGAAALVVTYAQRRSHDLAKFAAPRAMMSGEVRAPYVPLVNERIDRRHAHSIALSEFFRWYFETTSRINRTAGEFFLQGEDGDAPAVTQVGAFLSPVPSSVAQSLERVLPGEVKRDVGLGGDAWVTVLVERLAKVRAELEHDVGTLGELRDQAAADRQFKRADSYQRVINTLQKRELLGFLANHNVLPKYGFPVDSVELRTNFADAEYSVGARLDLSRDLSQAIYEYAPGSSIVAGGQVWTSAGLYKLPGRALQEFEYLVCAECGGFRRAIDDLDPNCPVCGTEAKNAVRTLTIPEFGFVAARETTRPGSRPPRRTWSGATHVLSESDEPRDESLELPGGVLSLRYGPRGRLIAISDGPGGAGYWVCEWCGRGVDRASTKRMPTHEHLLKKADCRGPARLLDLAHNYETDLLRIDVSPAGLIRDQATHLSVLYAILEAACDTVEISRDDIGGTLTPRSPGNWSLMFHDTVPGGAGHVLALERELPRILNAALRRMSDCDCGEETSCYGCLRSYGNQRHHELLSRGAAKLVLETLLGDSTDSQVAGADASPEEDGVSAALAIIEAAGLPHPDLGWETDDGLPVPVSFPQFRVAVDVDFYPEDRVELQDLGWVIVPAEGSAIQSALDNER